MASMALSIRFIRTCCSCTRSAVTLSRRARSVIKHPCAWPRSAVKPAFRGEPRSRIDPRAGIASSRERRRWAMIRRHARRCSRPSRRLARPWQLVFPAQPPQGSLGVGDRAVIGCVSSCERGGQLSHHADPVDVRKIGLGLPQPVSILFRPLRSVISITKTTLSLPCLVDCGPGEQHRNTGAVAPEQFLSKIVEASGRCSWADARFLPLAIRRRQLSPSDPSARTSSAYIRQFRGQRLSRR